LPAAFLAKFVWKALHSRRHRRSLGDQAASRHAVDPLDRTASRTEKAAIDRTIGEDLVLPDGVHVQDADFSGRRFNTCPSAKDFTSFTVISEGAGSRTAALAAVRA